MSGSAVQRFASRMNMCTGLSKQWHVCMDVRAKMSKGNGGECAYG